MLRIESYNAMMLLKDQTPIIKHQNSAVYQTQHGKVFKNSFGEYYLLTDSEFENLKKGLTEIPKKGERLLG